MAVCLLRLENFNPARLDLIGRYETRLWKQLAQTVYVLETIRRPPPARNRNYLGPIRAGQFSA
jgi:hypothetical protein